MSFTQLEFAIFLVLVLATAWACRRRTTRNATLLFASYYFYAYWDLRFCSLLLLSTVVDYWVARAIQHHSDERVRRRWLLLSVVVNLGTLGFFKYCNFFLNTARPIAESLGLNVATLSIILPVGISFYTFQTLSYTIDVYRRRIRATHHWLDFALYVSFFPQLVAGPIVRARSLLPQLQQVPPFSARRFYGGLQLLLRGAVKKILIADRLAETVDWVFQAPELYHPTTLWLALFAYAGQIYYDFSGYSDMACGIAKLLGYRFPINFRHPYLAKSPQEFWRRWHITLSTWLRDYLFIPLGGSRGSRFQTFRNLMLTMMLGGLWHGAAMTFVLWGAWHGLALCVGRWFHLTDSQLCPKRLRDPLGWALTMTLVLSGWLVFRSPDLSSALRYARGLVALESGPLFWMPPLTILGLFLMMVDHVAWTTRLRIAMRLPVHTWYAPTITVFLLWCLLIYAPRGFQPFVYFQF
ncbi:MAG: MBOAT family protein [Planctomycetota bacterium]